MDDLESTKETQIPLVHEGTQTGTFPVGYPGVTQTYGDTYDLFVQGRSLKDYPIIVFRYRLLIFSLILIGMLLSGVINHVSDRTFTAHSLVNVKNYVPPEDSSATRLLSKQTSVRNYVKTQVPLLESSSVAKRVLAINPVIRAYFKDKENFKLADYADEHAQLLASHEAVDLINPYELPVNPEARLEYDRQEEQVPLGMVQQYLSTISFTEVKDTTLVRVYVTSTRPSISAIIANAHAQAFIAFVKEQQQLQANQNINFLEERLIEANEKVEQATAAGLEYAQEHNLVTGDTRILNSTFEAKFRDIIRALNDSIFRKIELESEYKTLRRQNGMGRASSSGATGEMMRLARLEADYNASVRELGNSHPQTKFFKGKMNRVKDAIKQFGQQQIDDSYARYQAASRRESALRREFQTLHEKELKTSKHKVHYELLSKELLAAEEVQSELSDRLDEAVLAAENTQDTIQLIDPAITPSRPNGLNESSNLLTGAFLGGVIGVLIAFLLDFLDNTIRNEQELESVTNLPTLGIIPAFSDSVLSMSKAEAFLESQGHQITDELSMHLEGCQIPVMTSAPLSKESEHFRSLFTTITHSNPEHEPKILLITSAQQSDGKSTVATNTAVSFAQAGHRTILVDIDLRLPSVLTFFPTIESHGGVVNFLSGEDDFHEYIAETGVENLDVLFAGSQIHNPTAMLRSDRIRELIQLLEAEYEYVVIDSPPIGPCADAQILSRYVDGVVMVVRAGITPKPVVQSTIQRLVKGHAHVLGAVLNDARRADSYRDSSYYYMGNGYYNYSGYNGVKNGIAHQLNSADQQQIGLENDSDDDFHGTVATTRSETIVGALDESTKKQISQQASQARKQVRHKPRKSSFRFTLAHFGVILLAAALGGFLTWSHANKKVLIRESIPSIGEIDESKIPKRDRFGAYENEQPGEGYFRVFEEDSTMELDKTASSGSVGNSESGTVVETNPGKATWWVGEKDEQTNNLKDLSAAEEASATTPLFESKETSKIETVMPGWYLQVGSHFQKSMAENHLNSFKDSSFKAYLHPKLVGNIMYYRILVGPYESETAAKKHVSEIRRKGLARIAPVAHHIE